MLMVSETYLSLLPGISGTMRLPISLLSALPPFLMIFMLILLLCALTVNLWTMMRILIPLLIFLMNVMLSLMP